MTINSRMHTTQFNGAAADILVVDDHPQNLRLLNQLLTDHDYKAHLATNGEDALEEVNRHKPDLILLDIKMPGIDGFEVCRRLKSNTKTMDIPVIFISALAHTEEKVRAFDVGGVDYITKPFIASEMLARVDTHLSLAQARDSLKALTDELEERVLERTAELESNEEALQESSHYNRMLFDESTIGLALCRMNGELVDVNRTYATILGRTVAETLKLSYWEITPEKYAAEEQAQLENLEKIGRYGPYEKEYIHADGHLVPVRLSGQVLEKGGEQFIWSSAEDITERKQAEAALQESEKRLGLLVEQADFHLWSVDSRDLTFTQSLGGGLKNLGLRPNEVVGQTLYQFFQTDSPEFQPIKAHLQALEEKQVNYETEWQGRFFQSQITPQYDDNGKIVGCIGLAVDTTERKQAEEALRESEERFRMLVEQSPVGIGLSTQGRIRYVNSAYLRMFGYDDEADLTGVSLLDQIAPECREEIAERVARRFRGEAVPNRYETIGLKQDGTTFPFEVDVNLIDMPDGQATITFLTDLTERKQAEKALQRSEVLERLATGASLNDILTALVINAEKRSSTIRCSVTLLDDDGKHLRHGAAPSLPDFYNEAIDGAEIGPAVGSCAAAAYSGERVIVEDIMSHPNCVNYRELAEKADLRACWSEPVISSTGDVLGTFAIYNRKPCVPSPSELGFIRDSARLAAIAIERKQAEEMLQDSDKLWQSIMAAATETVLVVTTQGIVISTNEVFAQRFGRTAEDLVGTNVFDLMPADVAERRRKALDDAVKTKHAIYFEDGREGMHYQITVYPILDENGDIIRLVIFAVDVTERKQAEQKTKDLLIQNRDLTQRLFQIQEQERRHLSRELHDEFGQWLTVIRLNAHLLNELCSDTELDMRDSIKVIDDASSQMLQSARKMIHQLRPAELDELGLKDSVQELVNNWQKHYPKTHYALSLEGSLDDLEDTVNVTAYRIIQESLTNVVKYADADNVLIQLRRNVAQKDDSDCLLLIIKDDGKGMNLDEPTNGFGLTGIRERVVTAGGEFMLKSSPGAGVHIEIQLPITL